MGVNSLPKTVTRQRRGCDLNPGPSAPESSSLSTRLPSHPCPLKFGKYGERTALRLPSGASNPGYATARGPNPANENVES